MFLEISLQLDLKKNNSLIIRMHSTGFEPVMFQRKTDYESGAFNHSATNANMELMGIEPTSISNHFNILIYRHSTKEQNIFLIYSKLYETQKSTNSATILKK